MAKRSLVEVLWQNILIRTALYYVVLGFVLYLLPDLSVGGFGMLTEESIAALSYSVTKSGPAPSPPDVRLLAPATAVAMVSAFALVLPVSWIYTLTRKKKGWQQSVVQTLLVLPVIVAGIVVLVKFSLALAFGLTAIVTAVRFRNTLEDTKDAAYLLIGIGIGLAAGVYTPVAGVLSLGFNVLIVGLWYTDFGRTPAALEGKMAERRLERALEHASRTGTFVARMDDEVLKALAPEQLEALADRARRRIKRNAPELKDADQPSPEYATLLRLRTTSPDEVRKIVEPQFRELFTRWKFGDVVHEDDGMHVVEYEVDCAETVTPGVVNDSLRAAAGSKIVRLEMR